MTVLLTFIFTVMAVVILAVGIAAATVYLADKFFKGWDL